MIGYSPPTLPGVDQVLATAGEAGLRTLAFAARIDAEGAEAARRLLVERLRQLEPRPLPAPALLDLLLARVVAGEPSAQADAVIAASARSLLWTLPLQLARGGGLLDAAALYVAGCVSADGSAFGWRSAGHLLLGQRATARLDTHARLLLAPDDAVVVLDALSFALAAAHSVGDVAPAGVARLGALLARDLAALCRADGSLPFVNGPVGAGWDAAAPFGVGPASLRRALFGVHAAHEPVRRGVVVRPEVELVAISDAERHLVATGWLGGAPRLEASAGAVLLSATFVRRGRALPVHAPVALEYARLEELHLARLRRRDGLRHERLVAYAPGRLLAVFDRVRDATAQSFSLELETPDPAALDRWDVVPSLPLLGDGSRRTLALERRGDTWVGAVGAVAAGASIRRLSGASMVLDTGRHAVRVTCEASTLAWSAA